MVENANKLKLNATFKFDNGALNPHNAAVFANAKNINIVNNNGVNVLQYLLKYSR